MRKKKRRLLVPRLGPPENLRPAGPHKSKKLYDSSKMKAIVRKEDDGFFLGD